MPHEQQAVLGQSHMRTSRLSLLQKLYKQRYLSLMLFPAVALTLVFSYLPIVGWYMAFVNYTIGRSLLSAPWMGLHNFGVFFLEGHDYLYIIRNTLVMNLASIAINLVAAVAFAVLLRELVWARFSKLMQAATFFPFFISWVTTYSLVYAFLGSSSGAINLTLMKLGIIKEGINVLGSKAFAWPLIIGTNLWKYLGYNSVIFVASIAAIPTEQFEAARIDGAGRWGTIRHVTLPNLMPTVVVLVIMNSGWLLNSNFEQYYLFTNPTNWERMEVFDMYIYKFGLTLANFSYATAVGILRTVVSLVLLVAVNWISKRVTGNGIL